MRQDTRPDEPVAKQTDFAAPTLSLPTGGGAIRGIDEKFQVNPATGSGAMTLPIFTSPGRQGVGPELTLSYDSGSGNGPFGLGWSLSTPQITRKTSKGLPQYLDWDESDVFILSGAEDLVPVLLQNGNAWQPDVVERRVDGTDYQIRRYRPRVEGLFARIERWTDVDTGDIHWRSITRDNVTTLYGKTPESRIVDAQDSQRIFSWLICERYDDKGNAIIYRYKAEDSATIDLAQPNERNRTPETRSTNRYLKRILYGNATPRQQNEALLARTDWLFEVVFDYGEHNLDFPTPNEQTRWPARLDPFSVYRAGYEVRTYRLCRRVLMFHHFPDQLGVKDYLVRATEFTYTEGLVATYLVAATQSGYVLQGSSAYFKKSLPPVEFTYSRVPLQDGIQPNEANILRIKTIDAESLKNLPAGLDGNRYQFVDLDGEGLSGILTEQGGNWYYKPNLGDGHFGPQELVAAKPSLAQLRGGRQQLLDLAGDGQLDLALLDRPTPGFYERSHAEGWLPFTPFAFYPTIDWADPNLRFIDLTGDGLADVLITEDHVLSWHASMSEEGFGPRRQLAISTDEERGPQLVFSDIQQSIFLADMSGDGLTDLVRIRNGEICYWPNQGYGHFGAKVTMANAPWLDRDDLFDQRRIRLADIDGSGLADLIYLAGDGVHLYYNQAGNRWSDRDTLPFFPPLDNIASIQVVDLLGNGTACLVWSSPLPNDAASPMRYIDLMDGQKPHLLIGLKNNLGAETRMHYAPSTKFYLADQANLQPWVTRLPFPVHVVERVETYDQISRNRFVSRYIYHHGYFDGEEREFRGFGLVEQLDTEEFAALNQSDAFPTGDNIDATSHIPPVLTKSWFHNGAFLQRWRVSRQYEAEYYQEPGLTDAQLDAMLLPDTLLPDQLTIEEERQACRALKGATLRQEIYALDGSEEADRPYHISERNFTVKLLQPLVGNQYAVFYVHDRETLAFHYERKLFTIGGVQLADPRVSHAMTLAVDDFGNVRRSVAIGYGRRYDATDPILTTADRAKQQQLLVTYSENGYTNAVETADLYRAPLPSEAQTFQLYKAAPAANQRAITNLFRFDELLEQVEQAGDGNHDLPYRDLAGSGARQNQPYRRLIEQTRTLYRADDLGRAGGGNQPLLALGELESRALPGESYRLALTPDLLNEVYRRNGVNLLLNPVPILRDEGGYVRSNELKADGRFPANDPDNHWWLPSGRVYFSRNQNDAPSQELDQARQHFFLPARFRDPFGQVTRIVYDSFDLLHLESQDPLENRITVGERLPNGTVQNRNNYRVLQPELTTDPNGNRSEVAFDALGMVVGTAVMGKRNQPLGDSLTGFRADLTRSEIDDFFANPKGNSSAQLLGNATTRIIYDETRFLRQGAAQPTYAATLARETHASEPTPTGGRKLQVSISFSDGFGRAIQQKIQAEPGPLRAGGPLINPRWVGSGWTIFNNKGKPVKQYEPFFDDTHEFRFGHQVGVSPTLFYDHMARVVATLHPNHTWEKVLFDPWQQTAWDVNDTVRIDAPQTDPDVGDYFARLLDADYLPTWYRQRSGGTLGNAERDAATKAAAHADTPTTVYFDALGRPMLAVVNNGPGELYPTRTELDIEGNELAVRDAQDRIVMRYDYDMLGNRIHQASMEAGERWHLNDATGNAIRGWDSRGFTRRMAYDELRRPVNLFVADGQGEQLTERTVYGEGQGDANNHRGQVYQIFDSAGVATNERYDFKGNLLTSSRRFSVDYKTRPNWSGNPALAGETFTSNTVYDALNRPVTLTTPDNSVIRPTYNEANLLERVDANLRGANAATSFVANLDYDAKGQRQAITYGNGVQTRYAYDPLTFRLTQLRTQRGNADLQHLQYTYDPTGNITTIRDDAQQTLYFNNSVVEAHSDYTYDAIYRLIAAGGREHIGQAGQPQSSWNDEFRTNLPHLTDGTAMRRYTETYEYDAVGNILQLLHRATNGNWSRRYTYNEASLLEPGKRNNRLSSTTVGNETANYPHDIHGNMTAMPHLAQMTWDYKDQLQQVDLGGGGTAYYVYDAGGQRVRKVIERQNGNRQEERFYLGGFEVYRSYAGNGNTVALARETLHLMDDTRRIALVETRTQGNDGSPGQLIRYQLGNHLDSASLELDGTGQIISYEEYHPYGSTAYQAVRNQTAAAKRYRYTGKERDEESGLNYHGARYYAPWLGRWTLSDPLGIEDGVNLYVYVDNNPIVSTDKMGLQGDNEIDDILKFIYNEAGFRQGQQTPPTFDSKSASPFGTRAHQRATEVIDDLKQLGVRESERVFSEVAVNTTTGEVTRVGGKPIRGHHNIDIVVTPKGQSLARGQTFVSGQAEVVGDIKFGGGTITQAHSQFGQRAVTINSNFNSTPNTSLTSATSPTTAPTTAIPEAAATETRASRIGRSVRNVARGAVRTGGRVAEAIRNGARGVASVAAPIVRTGGRVLRAAGRVAAPLAIAESTTRLATATNNLDRIQAGADTLAGAAVFAGPVGEAYAGGYAAGQLLDAGVETVTGESLSSRGARGLNSVDQAISSALPTDNSLPEYKQKNRIAWWLIDTFGL